MTQVVLPVLLQTPSSDPETQTHFKGQIWGSGTWTLHFNCIYLSKQEHQNERPKPYEPSSHCVTGVNVRKSHLNGGMLHIWVGWSLMTYLLIFNNSSQILGILANESMIWKKMKKKGWRNFTWKFVFIHWPTSVLWQLLHKWHIEIQEKQSF